MSQSIAHPALRSYRGIVLMDIHHGLIVDCRITTANGYCEMDAAMEMSAELVSAHLKTIGADKNHQTSG